MTKKERKELISRMLEQIDDDHFLKKIFDYVHKYFIRRTGK